MNPAKKPALQRNTTGQMEINSEAKTFAQYMTEMGEWVYQVMHYCREAGCSPKELIEAHRNQQSKAA